MMGSINRKDEEDALRLFSEGLYEEASRILKRLSAENPANGAYCNALGLCFMMRHYLEEAQAEFGEACRREPFNFIYHFNLSRVLALRGLTEEAHTVGLKADDYRDRICLYFRDRLRDRVERLPAEGLREEELERYLEQGFRRTGSTLSRNICLDCDSCKQVRIDCSAFSPSPSQKRVLRKNRETEVIVNRTPHASVEKLELYARYMCARHDGTGRDFPSEFAEHYMGYAGSTELEYRRNGKLVGCGLADRGGRALYASIFFYSPDEPGLSLGVFNILSIINLAREENRLWLYLGERLKELSNMRYKTAFKPYELLEKSEWRRDREALVQ